MPLRAVYVFRPAMIEPLNGVESKTANYRIMYKLLAPFLSAARRIWPHYISTTRELGRALLVAAKHGTEKRIVEARQIREVLQSLS
jgi:hypothetical protein